MIGDEGDNGVVKEEEIGKEDDSKELFEEDPDRREDDGETIEWDDNGITIEVEGVDLIVTDTQE